MLRCEFFLSVVFSFYIILLINWLCVVFVLSRCLMLYMLMMCGMWIVLSFVFMCIFVNIVLNE